MIERTYRAAGVHQATWDTRGLARGVYYARFQAAGVSLSKAVFLLH
jgi:hypothetical protein